MVRCYFDHRIDGYWIDDRLWPCHDFHDRLRLSRHLYNRLCPYRIHTDRVRVRGHLYHWFHHDRIDDGRSLIHITHANAERFIKCEAPGIRHPHRHAMPRVRFIIQETAVGHRELPRARIDGKAATGRIGQTIRLGIACIRIAPRRRPYHRPRRCVLRYTVARQRDIRRRFVHIADPDTKGLVIDQPTTVRYPDRDAVARARFIVQEAPVRHRDHPGTGIDRKPPPRRIGQTVRLRVAGIGIRPRDRAHHRARRRILRYAVGGQGEVRRSLINHSDVITDLHVVYKQAIASARPCHDELDLGIC